MAVYEIADVIDSKHAPELQTVEYDRSIRGVLEEMFEEGHSQLGVRRDGGLVGVVSFRSVARALEVVDEIAVDNASLRERSVEIAVETPVTVSADEDVSVLFDHLAEEAYVIVESERTERIITDYDMLDFLQRAMEPFLLIEDIELALRDLLAETYQDEIDDRLRETFADTDGPIPPVTGLSQCSFSHYEIFISQHWEETFCEYFDANPSFLRELIKNVGQARNQLFHFRVPNRHEFDLDVIRFAHSYLTSVRPTVRSRGR